MSDKERNKNAPQTAPLIDKVIGRDGLPISVGINFPPGDITRKTPAVVILHGFKGFASWGFFPYTAERIAEAGLIAVRVNFSHNGVEDFGEDFSRLDLFEENTLLKEVEETLTICDALRNGELSGVASAAERPLAILGHSRGGGIALLSAARRADISAVVTWASVSTFHRYSDRQIDSWREKGYLEVKNSRTGQIMRLGKGLLEELENHAENIDIISAVRRLTSPLLILHGEVDLSVSVENAQRLGDAGAENRTRVERIPKAGHTFGAGHPFGETAPALEGVIDQTISFLTEHLL